MKKEFGFLIAAICFYIAAVVSFLFNKEQTAIKTGSFGILGTVNMVLFMTSRKKNTTK